VYAAFQHHSHRHSVAARPVIAEGVAVTSPFPILERDRMIIIVASELDRALLEIDSVRLHRIVFGFLGLPHEV
jgi:hypothetical protein